MPRKPRLKPISQQPSAEVAALVNSVESLVPTRQVARLTVYYRHLNTTSKEMEVHSIVWDFPGAKQMNMTERAILHAEMLNRDGVRVEPEGSGMLLWYPPERIVQMKIETVSVPDEKAALPS